MILSEQEKQDIRKKYENNVSKDVLNHLKRHFPVTEHDWKLNDTIIKIISVNDKEYWIKGNKKLLVDKISLIIEDEFPSIEKSVLRRTVKYYLDLLK
jgi:hypothetical protein